jgi:hypothetical protein
LTLKKLVSPSRHLPSCWTRWVTATRRLVTAMPVLVKRTSGFSTQVADDGGVVDVCTYTLTLKAEGGASMGGELQGAGGYRVGDADRNWTTELLKEAHAAGYLTLEETDERLGAALAARNRAELDRLVADLPPEWRAGQERGQRLVGPPQGQRPAFPPEVAWLVPLVVIVSGVMLLAILTRGFWFFPWPLLWIFFFAFGRRGRAGWRPPRW